jgi:protein-S-isoprenylcysteine O-methyltransferase Ste14
MKSVRVIAINLALSILIIVLAAITFSLDQNMNFRLPAWLQIPGYVLLISGSILILWAAFQLARRSGESGLAGDPTLRLVDSGPYGYLRNPIYGGDGLILLGLAFINRSPLFLLVSLLFILAIDVYVRKVEEPATEKRLGDRYSAYCERVPRWFPGSRRT